MELWDLYNIHREIVGEHIRGVEMPSDRYHLVVHVWIRNADSQYLMTRRSASRPSCPLKWECVGGSALKGETSLQAALREDREEVGIDSTPENCRLITTRIRDVADGRRVNDIVDVYLLTYDGAVQLSDATTDEVAQVRWMNKQEIKSLFHQGEMVRTIKDLSYFIDDTESAFY